MESQLLMSYKMFGLNGQMRVWNDVLDSLVDVEKKAEKTAKKFGVSLERLYDSICFDPLDFYMNPFDVHSDYKYGNKLVIGMLESGNFVRESLKQAYDLSGDDSTPRGGKKKIKGMVSGAIIVTAAFLGGYGIYDGISKIADAEEQATNYHSTEREIHDSLGVIYDGIRVAINYLDYEPPQTYITMIGDTPIVNTIPAEYPKPMDAKRSLEVAMNEYQKISGVSNLDKVDNIVKEINSRLPEKID